MAGAKITSFGGIAPKIAAELLPDTGAQIARNCKIVSGDLVPYPEPVIAGQTGNTSTLRAIYPLRNPTTDAIEWLSWDSDVYIATPSYSQHGNEQRFYYTGDGIPKVSNYALAMSGPSPNPTDYYRLGLPLPETQVTATTVAFAQQTIASIARDASGTATAVTNTDHGLRSGMNIAITGFTAMYGTYSRAGTTVTVTITSHGLHVGGTIYVQILSGGASSGAFTVVTTATANTFQYTETESGTVSGTISVDLRSFNVPSTTITVIDSDSFSYYSPGFQLDARSGGGKVDLSGQPVLRTYAYTWMTPWGEESVASEPSDDIIAREGQTVTITDLPQAPPATDEPNFIRGFKLYRTAASEVAGEYFELKTFWFPQHTASMSRTSGLTTMVLEDPHNFIEGDRFRLAACTDTTFNMDDGIVVDIIDDYTFTFLQAGGDVTTTYDAAGLLFHDVAETIDDDGVYWGYTSYDFTDDFDVIRLVTRLTSDEYIPPPEGLSGLKTIQNNILCGFVGKKLHFSEPDNPHAWPEKYEVVLDHNIVGVEPISGFGMLALTEGYPYILSGTDPGSFTIQRVDALYPCLSGRSIVAMNFGIVWTTHGGLAVYSPSSGPKMLTESIFDHDSWAETYDASTFVATFYDDAYFASHAGGSIVCRSMMAQGQQNLQFVECDESFDCVYLDKISNNVYYTKDTLGNVYQWDDVEQPRQEQTWKSKKIITKEYTNLGAARVVADYVGDALPTWSTWTTPWDDEELLWNGGEALTFSMWVEGELIFEEEINSKLPFRLPTGYRSDTFEFSVTGPLRVRAIHLAQTPFGLKEA